MGYITHYKVYNQNGKCLGTYSGWTGDEAVKQCKIFHPNETIGKVVSSGTAEHRK